MDENKIDVFQDEDTKQKEIFVDYSNEPKNPKEVSTKTAMIAIVATFIVLLIIGAAFTAVFFTAKSTGIESIIVDPGIGFDKSSEDGFRIINRIDDFFTLSDSLNK